MKPVEDKLNELEKEKTNINDASVAVNYLTQEIRKKVAESVEKANTSNFSNSSYSEDIDETEW